MNQIVNEENFHNTSENVSNIKNTNVRKKTALTDIRNTKSVPNNGQAGKQTAFSSRSSAMLESVSSTPKHQEKPVNEFVFKHPGSAVQKRSAFKQTPSKYTIFEDQPTVTSAVNKTLSVFNDDDLELFLLVNEHPPVKNCCEQYLPDIEFIDETSNNINLDFPMPFPDDDQDEPTKLESESTNDEEDKDNASLGLSPVKYGFDVAEFERYWDSSELDIDLDLISLP